MYKIVLSSSRNPSIRVRQFLNELELAIPNTVKINRGKMSISDLIVKALELNARYILYVMTRKGNPAILKFIEVHEDSYRLVPYAIKLFGVKLLIDMPIRRLVKKRARRALIIQLKDYVEVSDIFSQIFNLPVIEMSNLHEIDSIDKSYDTIILVRNVYNRDWKIEVQFLDGQDLGPNGPILRILEVKYLKEKIGTLS